jgi:hypothetical protein
VAMWPKSHSINALSLVKSPATETVTSSRGSQPRETAARLAFPYVNIELDFFSRVVVHHRVRASKKVTVSVGGQVTVFLYQWRFPTSTPATTIAW